MGDKGNATDGSLRDEDRELWEAFTRPIKPLRKKPAAPAAAKATPAPAAAGPRRPPPKSTGVPDMRPPTPTPPLALDRRTRAKVARGRTAIDRRIDLHGFTQAQAHSALLHFLRQSAAQEARTVLVITGKSGVLRQQVPHWLALPEFRGLIVGFERAAIRHGGDGALYLRLRRSRT